MVWGVSMAGWWFPQMAASFLAVAIVIIFISGLKEKEAVEAFTQGASELVAVSLIIGLARGSTWCWIRDDLGHHPSLCLQSGGRHARRRVCGGPDAGVHPAGAGGALLLGAGGALHAHHGAAGGYRDDPALHSGVGLQLGTVRHAVPGPTGLVLVTLQMLGIQFNQWVRFVLPMVGFVLGFGALMLVAQVMMI